MGKPEERQHPGIPEAEAETGGGPCAAVLAGIGRAVAPRCFVVVLLSACAVLSAIFWLPPFHSIHSGFVPDDADGLSAEIQASFILQKPVSLLAANAERLQYDIFEEIGVPNSKVSIISMHPLTPANSTYVVFSVLPDPKYASISSPALSVLRSSLIELVLQQLNLSLTPSIFGFPTSFEVLRFPGGITVIPVQSTSIWEWTQILFYFKLNNSIIQIQKNIDELKDQLKFGLNLKPYENVYVQMTNENGSTVAPPITVQASVLSDVGSRSLLPDRLKQLAQVIIGSNAKNLGLNHSVFGNVNQVQLSSYLQHSISSLDSPSPSPSPSSSASSSPSASPSPSPSPSLSPSPSDESPLSAPPLSLCPTLSPSYAPAPSTDHYHEPRCSYCYSFSPPGIHSSQAPVSGNGPQPPQSVDSPEPSVTYNAPSHRHHPYLAPLHPPNASPADHPYPPASDYSPNAAPVDKPPGPSQMVPAFSPLSPESKKSGKASMSPISVSSQFSPSLSSHVAPHPYAEMWLIVLLGFLIIPLLCGPY